MMKMVFFDKIDCRHQMIPLKGQKQCRWLSCRRPQNRKCIKDCNARWSTLWDSLTEPWPLVTHRDNLVEFVRPVSEICSQTDRQTDDRRAHHSTAPLFYGRWITAVMRVGGGRTFFEVEAKSGSTGTGLDVRRWVDARPAAVVDVTEMKRVVQRTRHNRRRRRRIVHINVRWIRCIYVHSVVSLLNSALHPSEVAKSSTTFDWLGWGKGGNVTSVE